MLSKLGGDSAAASLVRSKEPAFREKPFKLDSAAAVAKALAANPRLMERPLAVTADAAALGRPLENIIAILPGKGSKAAAAATATAPKAAAEGEKTGDIKGKKAGATGKARASGAADACDDACDAAAAPAAKRARPAAKAAAAATKTADGAPVRRSSRTAAVTATISKKKTA